MNRIARFKKVSFERFKEDYKNTIDMSISDELLLRLYESIKLPKRATIGSAGYDFFAPYSFILEKGETITIPTGIRCEMDNDWVLKLYPRSGHGFKYRVQIDCTVGIIDSDYYNSDNEGHIMLKLTNDTNRNDESNFLDVDMGTGIAQGVFLQYGITVDDNADGIRNGGFGSTTK